MAAWRTSALRTAVLVTILCLAVAGVGAQTVVKLPKNKYTPEQDVQLGREAAAEVLQAPESLRAPEAARLPAGPRQPESARPMRTRRAQRRQRERFAS